MLDSEHRITLDDAETLFRGRMGLIYGPGITYEGSLFANLANDIATKWNGQPDQNYLQNAQHALDQGVDPNDIKKVMRDALASHRAFPQLKRIANLKWSAVLSLSLDSDFERELTRACERKVSGFTATQVVEFGQVLPAKTIPVFKLLGTPVATDFVFSELTYVARRPKWRYAVQEFADRVKTQPVVCLGLAGCEWLLLDLLSQLLSEPKTTLSPLLLVESEFDAIMRKAIVELARSRMQVGFIDVPLGHVVSRIKDVVDAGATAPTGFPQASVRVGSTSSIPRHCRSSKYTISCRSGTGRDSEVARFAILAHASSMGPVLSQLGLPPISREPNARHAGEAGSCRP
jgi:hypothetical protein